MVDPTDVELCAMDDAGALGGSYLEELGKYDLASLHPDEWRRFIQVICGGYVDSLTEQQAKICRAMDRVTNLP